MKTKYFQIFTFVFAVICMPGNVHAVTLQETSSAKIMHVHYTFDGKFEDYLTHLDAQLGKYDVSAYQSLLKDPVAQSV